MFTNADPHPAPLLSTGIQFVIPDVMDMSTSKGSTLPFAQGVPDQTPIPNWEKQLQMVRLINARRRMAQPKKVDVNLDPEAEGFYAWERKQPIKSNPYTKKNNPKEHQLWLKGYLNNDPV